MKRVDIRDQKYIVLRWIVSIVCIWLVTLLIGSISLELPGVYYDAVYPDYLAAIGAFRGVDNFTQISRHVGLPLLGNYYHGTMTAGFQYIVLKCIGHANQFTLRIPNLIYLAITGSLIYTLCYQVSKSSLVPLLGTILCVTTPNVLAFPRTQYYIMLPGCVFFLSSISLIIKHLVRKEEKEDFNPKILLWAGIFQGLAFYGYFTYIFMAPVSFILIGFYTCGTLKQKIRGVITCIWGIFIGSLGYFIGYYDSLLTNIFGEVMLTRILLWGGIACMGLYLLIPIFIICKHGNNAVSKKYMRIFIAGSFSVLIMAFLAAGIMLFLFGNKFQSVKNLLVLSQTRNEGNRLWVFWEMMYMLVSNKSAQNIMFGEELNGFFGGYIYLGIIMSIIVAVIALLNKRKGQKDVLLKYIGIAYLYLIGYYFFTIPISVGMQPQHFVITYFLLFVIIILDSLYIGRHIPNYLKISMGLAVLVAGAFININNDSNFLKMLVQTEGRGRYSAALDHYAETALEDNEKENKVYVFPQWGFLANFIYLTENSCMTIRDADIEPEILQEKLEQGYTLVVSAFDKSEIDIIIENLEADSQEWQEVKSKEGDYVFSYVTIKKGRYNN